MSSSLIAQSLYTVKDAVLVSNRRYKLTDPISGRFGAVFSKNTIDLNESFDLLCKVNLGNRDNGADGMCFVFHQIPNFTAPGFVNSSEFGLTGITPSLCVELDTYTNAPFNDNMNDHIAIQKNGNFTHGTADNLMPPINMIPGSSFLNAEDGNDHMFRIYWNATTKTMKVYFDCVERMTLPYDLVANIFNNNSKVYWGFTGATGAQYNQQEVDILRCSALDDYNELPLCNGGLTQLSASYGDKFTWQPTTGLTALTTRTPTANVSSTTTYIATVEHGCSLIYNDTIKVIRPNLTPINWDTDIKVCEGDKKELDATAPDGKTYRWLGGYSDSAKFIPKISNNYVVSITDGNCTSLINVNVVVNPAPKFSLGADQDICSIQPISLNATNANAVSYLWSTGELTPKIDVAATGKYWAEVTSSEGCKYRDTIDIKLKAASTYTQTISLCPDSSYVYKGVKFSKDTTANYTIKNGAQNGCDSVYTLVIKLKKRLNRTITSSICEGKSYNFYGKTCNSTGKYTHVPIGFCDSLITLDLNVIKADTSIIDTTICKNTSLLIDNKVYSTAGQYFISLAKAGGCTQYIKLKLAIDEGKGFELQKSICQGEIYDFYGQKVSQQGSYTKILQNRLGCDSIITLNLTVKNPTPLKIKASKKAICDKESIVLTTETPYNSYIWNTTETTSSITINSGGQFKLTVTDENNCVGIDSIQINQNTAIIALLNAKIPTCTGYADGSISITNVIGGTPPYSYSIDGQTYGDSTVFRKLKEGTYNIYIKDAANCVTTYTKQIQQAIPKRIQISESSKFINLGDSTSVSIIPTFTDIKNITWTPAASAKADDLDVWLKPVFPTRYSVVVIDSVGCVYSDTVYVGVDSRLQLYVPNVFSANVDGTNDEFRPFAGIAVKRILTFEIFDRWGNKVFEANDFAPNDENIKWNGTFRGSLLNQGVYLSYVRVLKLNGEIENIVSEVTMLH